MFFVPIFICVGYLLYDLRANSFKKKHYCKKLLISTFLLSLEGAIIFINQGIDKNFFISLIPYTAFLFNWCLRTKWLTNVRLDVLKDYSRYYYFVHPFFIEFLSFPIFTTHFPRK